MVIDTEESLIGYLKDFAVDEGFNIWDTETTGLKKDSELLIITIYDCKNKPASIFVDNDYFDGIPIERLRAILNPYFERGEWVAHNGKFDLWVFTLNLFFLPKLVHDTMVIIQMVDTELEKNLERRVNADFGISKKTFKEIFLKGFDKVDWYKDTRAYKKVIGKRLEEFPAIITKEKFAEYADGDAEGTEMLLNKYLPILEKDLPAYDLYKKVEMPIIHVLLHMKLKGVEIDVHALSLTRSKVESDLEFLKAEIFRLSNSIFNIKSPQQLAEVLYDILGYPSYFETEKGSRSVGKEALKQLASEGYEVAEYLYEYGKLSKLLSAYLIAIPEFLDADGRLRGDMNSVGTKSGRFSSNNPNLQNMPTNDEYPIRNAFKPKEGFIFVGFDMKQVEPRILSHCSKDPNLQKIFLEGKDIYQGIADTVKIKRKEAKVLVLAIMYGMGYKAVAASLKIQESKAKVFLETFYQKYPNVTIWKAKIKRKAYNDLSIRTLFGRKRNLCDLPFKFKNSFGGKKRHYDTQIANSIIQGTAADIMKKIMIDCFLTMVEYFPEANMLLQVHDELIFEVPIEQSEEFLKAIQKTAESCVTLSVPLLVDIKTCHNWAQMKDDDFLGVTFDSDGNLVEDEVDEELYLPKYRKIVDECKIVHQKKKSNLLKTYIKTSLWRRKM